MNSEARFNRFQGNWLDATFLDERLEGVPIWENPKGIRSCDINWTAFLSGMPHVQSFSFMAYELENCDLPLMVLLPRLLKSFSGAARRSRDAPRRKDIATQIALFRSAAEGLAAVAIGGRPKTSLNAEPEWWMYDEDDAYRRHIEVGRRKQDRRSKFLHPLLQEHLVNVMLPDHPFDDCADVTDQQRRAARRQMITFFEYLHILLPILAQAEVETRNWGSNERKTRPGAPEDEVRNWSLVRLMWVWRDVLGEKPTIYLKKIDNIREMDAPEPQGCMAFVVAVRAEFDAVNPWNFPALERQLQSLKAAIPESSLLR